MSHSQILMSRALAVQSRRSVLFWHYTDGVWVLWLKHAFLIFVYLEKTDVMIKGKIRTYTNPEAIACCQTVAVQRTLQMVWCLFDAFQICALFPSCGAYLCSNVLYPFYYDFGGLFWTCLHPQNQHVWGFLEVGMALDFLLKILMKFIILKFFRKN